MTEANAAEERVNLLWSRSSVVREWRMSVPRGRKNRSRQNMEGEAERWWGHAEFWEVSWTQLKEEVPGRVEKRPPLQSTRADVIDVMDSYTPHKERSGKQDYWGTQNFKGMFKIKCFPLWQSVCWALQNEMIVWGDGSTVNHVAHMWEQKFGFSTTRINAGWAGCLLVIPAQKAETGNSPDQAGHGD